MNITCDIIRDLLPLYAEDMVSEDSKHLVDEHLCGCEGCTNELSRIKKCEPISVEVSPEPLNHVRKMIVRRRTLSVMASVLTVLTLAAFVISYLFTPFQLTAEQALDDFYIQDDGAVVVDYSSAVIGRSRAGFNENWYLIQYSTRYDVWKGENRKSIEELYGTDGVITEDERQRYENIDIIYGSHQTSEEQINLDAPIPQQGNVSFTTGGSEWNWWYSDPTGLGNDTLLHDAGKEMPDKADRYMFAPIFPMIFFGGIVGIFVLLLLQKITEKPWLKEMLSRIIILCGSIVFSTLFVSSGRIFTSYVGVIDQYWGWMIGIDTVFLALSILFWRQLHKLNKQDKGE